jgi:hypothetical protein
MDEYVESDLLEASRVEARAATGTVQSIVCYVEDDS